MVILLVLSSVFSAAMVASLAPFVVPEVNPWIASFLTGVSCPIAVVGCILLRHRVQPDPLAPVEIVEAAPLQDTARRMTGV
jgi:hypothetical protein